MARLDRFTEKDSMLGKECSVCCLWKPAGQFTSAGVHPEKYGRKCKKCYAEMIRNKHQNSKTQDCSHLYESGTMREPLVVINGKRPIWQRPSRDWLVREFCIPPIGLGKTAAQITKEVGASRPTVDKWIRELRLAENMPARHSFRMSGNKNPAWSGGSSRAYHKRLLKKTGRPMACEWCDDTNELHLHHRDHNIQNGELSNLGWLCYHCNLLEAHMFGLAKDGKAAWAKEDDQISITFFRAAKLAAL